jgi:hypothetical protein
MSRELFTQRFPFSAWQNPTVPPVAAGVYAIWKGDDLIYCCMSGREIEAKTQATPKKYGLLTRLASHASGRLSGDQFCVYLANRFVIPMLSADDVPLFASGELNLDARTRRVIHTHLDYAYALARHRPRHLPWKNQLAEVRFSVRSRFYIRFNCGDSQRGKSRYLAGVEE